MKADAGTGMDDLEDLRTLEVVVDDGIAVVTLQRPEVLNAFDDTMVAELAAVWAAIRRSSDVRVVVLTGAGDRAFCSGYDRRQLDDETAGLLEHDLPIERPDVGEYISPKTAGMWKPVVAAVNGLACGGAFYLLGESDLILAADTATFFDPHLSYGMPAVFEPVHLLQRMPLGEVLRLSLLGAEERMSAATAERVGLVSEVVAGEQLLATAMARARTIAAAPPAAVQATLRAIWSARDLPRSQVFAMGGALVDIGTDVEAIAAGQSAFSAGGRREWRLR